MTQDNLESSDREPTEGDPSSSTLAPHTIPSEAVRLDLAGLSHEGHIRDNNEDHYLALRMTRSQETILTNLKDGLVPEHGEIIYGMVVADGMGGMAAGEVASSMALLRLLELVVQTPDWIMKVDQGDNATVVMRRMTQRFRQIDDELRVLGEADRELLGMGTTLTLAASLGPDLFISHIGDSRAYLLRGDKIYQLTKDHTLAQALIDANLAQPDETSIQSMKHVLTAALGSTGKRTDPEVQRLHLQDGDQLLLCTDGLTEMVTDEGIAAILLDANSSATACQGLVNLALAGGGKDNITVVLARYRFSQDDDAPPA